MKKASFLAVLILLTSLAFAQTSGENQYFRAYVENSPTETSVNVWDKSTAPWWQTQIYYYVNSYDGIVYPIEVPPRSGFGLFIEYTCTVKIWKQGHEEDSIILQIEIDE